MIRKELTYENFEGEVVTDEAFFHLTRAEMMKMDAVMPGGMLNYAAKIKATKNPTEAVKFMDMLLLSSYGIKTPEGRFVKPKEMTDAFACSEAYSVLLEEMMSSDGAIEEFVRGILPKVPQDHEQKKAEGTKLQVLPGKSPIDVKVTEVVKERSETEEERIERIVQERLRTEREKVNAETGH